MRTTIECSRDGNILVTREAPCGVPGSARARRRAARLRTKLAISGCLPKLWRKVARVILRNDAVVNIPTEWLTGIQILPLNSEEIALISYEAIAVTHDYLNMAAFIVQENAEKFAAYPVVAYKNSTEEKFNSLKEVLEMATSFVQRSPDTAESCELYAFLEGAQENLYELRDNIFPKKWECHAAKFQGGYPGGGDPPDCDFPFCGCCPDAGKVIDALVEIGWKKVE